MPGLKPPPPPTTNPIPLERRQELAREFDALLTAYGSTGPVSAERLRRVATNLLQRDVVTGDEVTEARLLAAKLSTSPPPGPGLARILRTLADQRGRQLADREPAWILGNPASELRQA